MFWLLVAGIVIAAVVTKVRKKPETPESPRCPPNEEKKADELLPKSNGGGIKNSDPNSALLSPDEDGKGLTHPNNNVPPPPKPTPVNSGKNIAPKPTPPTQSNIKEKRQAKKEESPSLHSNSPPGIVCWEDHDQQWVVGVEARRELNNLKVRQNGEPLEEEDNSDGKEAFVCLQLDSCPHAVWEEGGKEKSCQLRPPCGKEGYAIFSTRADWKGMGRRVDRRTFGCYLVIAPNEWSRISGMEPAESRHDGYSAHFFYFEPDGEMDGFHLPNGETKYLMPMSGRFELQGKKMPGIYPSHTPLFGAPPTLHDKQEWAGTAEIVVGGEALDERTPRPSSGDCALASLLAKQQGGLFAVRVDNKRGESVEPHMNFQFMRRLQAIDIRGVRLLPNSGGHLTAEISFQGDCDVFSRSSRADVVINGREAKIAPHPDNDKTQWKIQDSNASVEFDILLERIWWARGMEDQEPKEWTDEPILLTQEDFSLTDKKNGLWIKLPRHGFVKHIEIDRVDMEFPGKMRRYPAQRRAVCACAVFAPLIDFTLKDGREIRIRISPNGRMEEAVIAHIAPPKTEKSHPEPTSSEPISSEPISPEPISPEPTSLEPTSPEPTSLEPASPEPTSPEPTSPEPTSPEPTSPEPTSPEPTSPEPTSLEPSKNARVVGRAGYRAGKGFSAPELTAAGWTLAQARTINLPVDIRRKTVHNWNIKSLKHLREAL